MKYVIYKQTLVSSPRPEDEKFTDWRVELIRVGIANAPTAEAALSMAKRKFVAPVIGEGWTA